VAGSSAPTQKSVWFFGNGRAEGSRGMKDVLGGKGAGLAEMTNLGVPVPPGFTVSCACCAEYLSGGSESDALRREVAAHMIRLEETAGRRLGDAVDPLLVSVRSGARISMPGMMDTILNLGLNDETVRGLARSTGNARFAWDAYRRFVQMYGDVVLGVPAQEFERVLSAARLAHGAAHDADLSEESLRAIVGEFKDLVQRHGDQQVPADPEEQLWGAIRAVWRSWTTRRAVDYRRVNRIADDIGTAVNVQAMVFGNFGNDSGSGVAFTRNPSTGERRLFGEFLPNAQGEDVVAGVRTPLRIEEMSKCAPRAWDELQQVQQRLEHHYGDMQDVEFTVERGRLYMLQTRTGKRTAAAAVRIAADMVSEGALDTSAALLRVPPNQLDQLLHPVIAAAESAAPICYGLPASPGAASGVAVFDPDAAEIRSAKGHAVILVREETTPEDFHGIVASRAVLTARGGMTSHAAVVARGMGKCAVVGCSDLEVHLDARQAVVRGQVIREGDWLTLDGATGRVFLGQLPTTPSEVVAVSSGQLRPEAAPSYRAFATLLGWADNVRTLKVRANADTPADARVARGFGAEGIGLCRTEHMFFEGDRIHAMRRMIVARDEVGRREALDDLLPLQRADFEGIFEAMSGYPVTIRLLDPPLHEFLPHGGEESKLLARQLGLARAELARIVESLREVNPMLGHRGCRLGISYPEITEMQARAIFEAALNAKLHGADVRPEIMIPLVSTQQEFDHQRIIVEAVGREVLGEDALPWTVGTMIELPRAALTAGRIAQTAEFFSFGTNDLTQTTFGLSRDDAGRFLPNYVERGILPDDPFRVLDQEGVGKLIEFAIAEGRRTRPGLKVGICGEHGGDPASIAFCQSAGMDYVSCSPFRVPVARLAAAQAALTSGHSAPVAEGVKPTNGNRPKREVARPADATV
jgi:pyruvate,orthophosphate dikinase